jgi:hypothetical protein
MRSSQIVLDPDGSTRYSTDISARIASEVIPSPRAAHVTTPQAPRSLRRAYQEWVEEQVEEFKDSIPRGDLLRMADDVVRELRMTQRGQYQLTELLLCNAMDRHIIRLLHLPGYRLWRQQVLAAQNQPLIPHDLRMPEALTPAVLPVREGALAGAD